jgi:hypothetical protein
MPLSSDPQKRETQLANLRQGVTTAPTGNARAKTHGAFAVIARERLEERELAILDALSADLPLTEADGSVPPADAVVISLFAEVLCRLADVKDYHGRRGIESAKGVLRPSVEVEGRLRREALDFAESLGMTPRSRARLGLELQRGQINDERLTAERESREARARLDQRMAALDDKEEPS